MKGIGVLLVGYLLMMGGNATHPNDWNPEIFSFVRLSLSPFLIICGYVIVGLSIWKQAK